MPSTPGQPNIVDQCRLHSVSIAKKYDPAGLSSSLADNMVTKCGASWYVPPLHTGLQSDVCSKLPRAW